MIVINVFFENTHTYIEVDVRQYHFNEKLYSAIAIFQMRQHKLEDNRGSLMGERFWR